MHMLVCCIAITCKRDNELNIVMRFSLKQALSVLMALHNTIRTSTPFFKGNICKAILVGMLTAAATATVFHNNIELRDAGSSQKMAERLSVTHTYVVDSLFFTQWLKDCNTAYTARM